MIARESLDELHDELYVLACAVDDAESDLATELAAPKPRPAELRRIIDSLIEAARPLRAREIPATSSTENLTS